MNRLMVMLFLILALVANPSRSAFAHSYPKSESPPAGACLDSPPASVTIRFDSPVEKLFAKLQVFSSTGTEVDKGAAKVGESGTDLSVDLNSLAPGEYTVKWGVTGHDSHTTHGSYTFTVLTKAAR